MVRPHANRLNLSLNFDTSPAALAPKKNTAAELARMDKSEVSAHLQTRFALNHGAPAYEVALQACGDHYNGWEAVNRAATGTDAFIHLSRINPKSQGEFAGDKVHLSVLPEHVPKAFTIIGQLVNADDGPVDTWKVTDMTLAHPDLPIEQQRVLLGAQFTIYAKPDQVDNTYSPEYMGKMCGMVMSIEQALQQEGVAQSPRRPDSDISLVHWQFTSYRNEYRSDRTGSSYQNTALGQEPFFQLMESTDTPPAANPPAQPSLRTQTLLG